ncbi:hypothetical protein ENUP19_0163G0033 [Entamoeba nuttalli]
MNHPYFASFIKGQKEEEWSYLPSFLKTKPPKPKDQIDVQAVIFDEYPKDDNELRKCCIICESHGIRVWDCDDITKNEEVFSYPVEDNVIPLFSRFRHISPPMLFFVTSNNQLVSVTFKPEGPIASSFFSYNYCDFELVEDILFAFTLDGQLHIYNTTQNPPSLILQISTTKYLKNTHPIAVSSAYFAYPTYDIPPSYVEPPQSAAAITTETITSSINWITDGVKNIYGAPTQPQEINDNEHKKEFVVVADHRSIISKKQIKRICHFCATASRLRTMKFDPKGELLVTCDDKGYLANVFRVHPNGYLDHLFVLKRGTTTAVITDISFTPSCDLVVVSSSKTSHLFTLPPTSCSDPIKKNASTQNVVWINASNKIHTNEDCPITVTFSDNNLVQAVSSDLGIYQYVNGKISERGHVDMNIPCTDQYMNQSLFMLPTSIGEDDFYKSVDTRIIPFDDNKFKRYTNCQNKFAIGSEAIEKQKLLLEAAMNEWVSATSNVFDIDYIVKDDSEAGGSECADEPNERTEIQESIECKEDGQVCEQQSNNDDSIIV